MLHVQIQRIMETVFLNIQDPVQHKWFKIRVIPVKFGLFGLIQDPKKLSVKVQPRQKWVPEGGIEPPTKGLWVPCSTAELPWLTYSK